MNYSWFSREVEPSVASVSVSKTKTKPAYYLHSLTIFKVDIVKNDQIRKVVSWKDVWYKVVAFCIPPFLLVDNKEKRPKNELKNSTTRVNFRMKQTRPKRNDRAQTMVNYQSSQPVECRKNRFWFRTLPIIDVRSAWKPAEACILQR